MSQREKENHVELVWTIVAIRRVCLDTMQHLIVVQVLWRNSDRFIDDFFYLLFSIYNICKVIYNW